MSAKDEDHIVTSVTIQAPSDCSDHEPSWVAVFVGSARPWRPHAPALSVCLQNATYNFMGLFCDWLLKSYRAFSDCSNNAII